MIQEEYGLRLEERSPLRAAAVTFCAFLALGALPLVAFLLDFFVANANFRPYLASTILTAVSLFFVGAIKARFLSAKWYRAGAETLVIGGAAASLAYLVGSLLASFAPLTYVRLRMIVRALCQSAVAIEKLLERPGRCFVQLFEAFHQPEACTKFLVQFFGVVSHHRDRAAFIRSFGAECADDDMASRFYGVIHRTHIGQSLLL